MPGLSAHGLSLSSVPALLSVPALPTGLFGGVDLVTAAAVALLVLGVVGSVVPLLPGAELSLLGVYLHWWGSGYTEPGLLLLAAFTLFGLAVVVVDYGAGAVSAKAGGASWTTSLVAGVVGLIGLVAFGPLGLLVGTAGTAFLLEFYRSEDAEASAKTALYTTVGILGSAVVQLLATLAMLVAFLAVVVV